MANNQSKTGSQGSNQGSTKNPGNFANDREKASEAGRKGGQSSGGNKSSTSDKSSSSESGRKGGRS